MFYFGAGDDRGGHFMWLPQQRGYMKMRPSREQRAQVPWSDGELDSGLAPEIPGKNQPEGICAIHFEGSWTAMAFWDRTGDKRFNSNSVVLAEGEYTFDEMVDKFRTEFSEIYERVTAKFELVEAK